MIIGKCPWDGNRPGRPGWSPTQAPHDPDMHSQTHLALHLHDSRYASAIRRRFVDTLIRSRRTSTCFPLQRFIERRPLPSPGSLGLVPLVQRYYETLRLLAALLAALRFLRLAIPSFRPSFVPVGLGRGPRINLGVVQPGLRPALRWRRQGLPSSRGTLMIIRHVPPTPV